MSTTTPIVDFVRRYAQSGTSRLHMPGHKGQSLLGFEPWDICLFYTSPSPRDS